MATERLSAAREPAGDVAARAHPPMLRAPEGWASGAVGATVQRATAAGLDRAAVAGLEPVDHHHEPAPARPVTRLPRASHRGRPDLRSPPPQHAPARA